MARDKMDSWLFQKYAFNQHDVVCNQKYGDIHPYSFHLTCVYAQSLLWSEYLPIEFEALNAVRCGLYGHDLIEDARVSFNEIAQLTSLPILCSLYLCNVLQQNETKQYNERVSELQK